MKKHTGAASFYIVAFATLLLTIVALGFAALVISEARRTLDSDLSQSAYDSALAGVEDAKLAILNYQSCINQGYGSEPITFDGKVTCGEIVYYMNHPDCDMVGHILGRIKEGDPVTDTNGGEEVAVQEQYGSNSKNDMQQAYTCVEITSNLSDYRATLTSDNNSHIVPIVIDDPNEVKSIRVSWYSDTDGTTFKYNNVLSNNAVSFPKLTASQVSTPPAVSVELIQTAVSFDINASSFNISNMTNATSGSTNHGTLYFVPTNKAIGTSHDYMTKSGTKTNSKSEAMSYNIANINKENTISMTDKVNFATSNDKTSKNVPITLYCPENSGNEFACSVTIELPQPNVGTDGNTARNSDTFMLILTVPYGQPDTDFAVELCDDSTCSKRNNVAEGTDNGIIDFTSAQYRIDSTGRANDLYRRVETRMENLDSYFPMSAYAIQLTGEGQVLTKNITTTFYGL